MDTQKPSFVLLFTMPLFKNLWFPKHYSTNARELYPHTLFIFGIDFHVEETHKVYAMIKVYPTLERHNPFVIEAYFQKPLL